MKSGKSYNQLNYLHSSGHKASSVTCTPSSIEICAGAGGQALGLEQAGFAHQALIEIEPYACESLRINRPHWNVFEDDLRRAVDGQVDGFKPEDYRGIDLIAGGVPCPPFSKAGRQLGKDDERDLFPAAVHLVEICRPKAVMLENVRGLLDAVFEDYRSKVDRQLRRLGYVPGWRLLNASDFGVPQLRPRVVIVAVSRELSEHFTWPDPYPAPPPGVGDVLFDLMASRGWKGATEWRNRAAEIAPTLVGGSTKHGGPDLGPTRAKRAWETLGVNGHGLADEAPAPDFVGSPKLTVRMTARLQGFPDDWQFSGKKTAAYRQVGNAFPPPVAGAVGHKIMQCLARRRIGAA